MKLICLILFLPISVQILSQDNTLTIESRQIYLSETEKEWIKEHPVITVGMDPYWAPFEFRDEKGVYHGMSTDYLDYIEEKVGLKFEIVDAESWDELYKMATRKEIDMLTGVVKTSERMNDLIFTEPYHTYPVTYFAIDGTPIVRDLSELPGKKIGFVRGYFVENHLIKKYPEIEVVPVKTIEDGLKKLLNKEFYLFVESMPTGSYYIYKKGYKSIRIVGEAPFKYKISMGVRNDWPILRDILEEVLASMTETAQSSIYHNWISPKTKEFDYSVIWKIFIPLLVILLFTVYWNRRLAVEVKKRKMAQKELDEAFKKLKNTQLHLVQTEKMASVGLLTAGIAHEIKNPLNFIPYGLEKLGEAHELYSQLIKKYEQYSLEKAMPDIKEIEKLKKEKEYDYYVQEMGVIFEHLKDCVERISEIVKSVDSFSHVAGDEMSFADINEGIESTLVLLKNQYKYNIEIVKELGDLPDIKCFPGKLNQVFVNLITNAIQAIEDRGTIWIKTYKDNNFLKISIKDSGLGIPEDKLSEIFDSFYTTKPAGEGTGLGLAISKNIIDEHNGSIDVYSELNVGTEFIITLPIS